MKKQLDFSKINYETFEETYKHILRMKEEEIILTIEKLISYEEEKKGVDFETLILMFLEHKNDQIRLLVTKYMSKSSDLSTIRRIKKIIINEKKAEIRNQAINIFGIWISYYVEKNKTKEIKKSLDFGLDFINNSKSDESQNMMLQSISFINNNKIDKLIMKKYSSKKNEDINSSIISMGNNGNTKWIPLLEDNLDHNYSVIRTNSCISLSYLGNEEHLDQIKDLLEDEELETQKAAVLGISNISGVYAKSLLEQLRFSSEPEIVQLSKIKLLEIKADEGLDSSDTSESEIEEEEDNLKNKNISDFDEYNAAEIEGWGSLNPDGTSFIAPDAVDDDIDDPIKSLADYEKPIDQPRIDD
tara:strand:+ start:44508 stop:45581 length:1074 start_codon:yes stop_codon:yes gene_type:complete